MPAGSIWSFSTVALHPPSSFLYGEIRIGILEPDRVEEQPASRHLRNEREVPDHIELVGFRPGAVHSLLWRELAMLVRT
jgi:hypothetical protein